MSSAIDHVDLAREAEEHGLRYVAAFNAGDVETLETMYTEDAISVWEPGNPLSGQARRDALRELVAMKPKMTATLRESHVTSDTALLVVDWSIDLSTPEGDQHLTGVGLDVLRRRDGGWLFAVDNPFGADGDEA